MVGDKGVGLSPGGGDTRSAGGREEGLGLVATVGDGRVLGVTLSTSFFLSSFHLDFVRVGEIGTPGAGTSVPLSDREDMTGPAGATRLVVRCRLGITVKELRDWMRRLARALAWVSPSGICCRSGLGAGRISNPGAERTTFDEMGLEGATARARRVSGEHGTLGFGGTSELSQSLSLASLLCTLSGSSLPPRGEGVACNGLMVRWGLPGSNTSGCGLALEDQELWMTGNKGWLLATEPGPGFGTGSGCCG